MYVYLYKLTVSLSISAKGAACDPVAQSAYSNILVMNAGELPGLLAALVLLDVIGPLSY
jgi:hypothetical protein